MSRRIGELLTERGLITREQLQRALRAQLVFGGHLGTCLIEAGFLDERALGSALAEMYGVPYAPPELLNGPPDRVLAALPRELAERHQAVPIRLERDVLHLAVVDPRSLGNLSERTGKRIVPWIAPEIRVRTALRALYGIECGTRLVDLCGRLERGATRGENPPGPVPAASVPGRGARADADSGGGPEERAALSEDLGAEFGYGRSWRDVAAELFGDDAPAQVGDRPERPTAPDPPREEAPPEDAPPLYRRMSRVAGSRELARIVLDHLGADGARAILFAVRGGAAHVWDWSGADLVEARARAARFPVTAGSIFETMLGDGHFRGPLPTTRECLGFYETVGLEPPLEALLAPAYVDDRLAAIVYADGGPGGRLGGATGDYLTLAAKLGLSMKMLVLQAKIAAGD